VKDKNIAAKKARGDALATLTPKPQDMAAAQFKQHKEESHGHYWVLEEKVKGEAVLKMALHPLHKAEAYLADNTDVSVLHSLTSLKEELRSSKPVLGK
jgi:hypothetical protein